MITKQIQIIPRHRSDPPAGWRSGYSHKEPPRSPSGFSHTTIQAAPCKNSCRICHASPILPQVWNPGVSTGNLTDDDEQPPLLIRHLRDNDIDRDANWPVRWLNHGVLTVSNPDLRAFGNLPLAQQEGCAGDVAETSIAP
jgi:hypothetical protein